MLSFLLSLFSVISYVVCLLSSLLSLFSVISSVIVSVIYDVISSVIASVISSVISSLIYADIFLSFFSVIYAVISSVILFCHFFCHVFCHLCCHFFCHFFCCVLAGSRVLSLPRFFLKSNNPTLKRWGNTKHVQTQEKCKACDHTTESLVFFFFRGGWDLYFIAVFFFWRFYVAMYSCIKLDVDISSYIEYRRPALRCF